MNNKNIKREYSLFFSMLAYVYISFHFIIISKVTDAYNPSENIVLNCGSSASTPTPDGRTWQGDVGSKFGPFVQPKASTTTSTASTQHSSIASVPYMTARISHSQFTYSFAVSGGTKFIRLYFYPVSYSGLHSSKAFFSVTTNRITLLSNFSASLTAEALKVSKITREFCVNAKNQMLNLTFTPSPNMPDAYAFVNGIEVVSMPPNLYNRGETVPLEYVGRSAPFFVDNTTALEMMYRLNVGGGDISPKDDTGMFREWLEDGGYLLATGVTPANPTIKIRYSKIPSYTAPEVVYRSARTMGMTKAINLNYNLTWYLPVDSGFNYLVRLHFCEFQQEVTKKNDREFHIFINNQTVEEQADVIVWSGGNGIPVYRDYIVWMVPEGSASKQDLLVALHPNEDSRTRYIDAILNGLEVFKLSDTHINLAGPNPEGPEPSENSKHTNNNHRNWTPITIAGGVLGGVAVLSLLCCFIWRLRLKTVWCAQFLETTVSIKTNTSSLTSDPCRHFSFAEIIAASDNFDDTSLIGIGGFGNVYKGYIDSGATAVAMKRMKPKSHQGAREFQTEIEMLSQLRHRHLVSLIGYCNENREMILIYEYMSHGTLRDHLYKTHKPPLSWKQRLQICIGAARGLHYLHTGAKHTIIHRDVKTTNILLDEKWVAKVSDFGLSKVGSTSLSHAHVSTMVKGTFGYLDPEYCRLQQLTEKSDVYSFGVVLFEVVSARPAVNSSLEEKQVNLADWALNCYERGTLDQIVDPHLRGQIAPECFIKFTEIAKKCLANRGIERPTMGDVLWNLELALEVQNSTVGGSQSGITGEPSVMIVDGRSLDNRNSDLTPGVEFSEIIDPIGR